MGIFKADQRVLGLGLFIADAGQDMAVPEASFSWIYSGDWRATVANGWIVGAEQTAILMGCCSLLL
ncbi:protein of unknown function [Pseudomonas marincola]|uniref:Uncharacterized protein n=1 Tax=Pseudomonas marincola TaxID=437900 RepID=A0A8S2BDT2_9PSED|nr:protein of unknown function [Pseudomonas marincola]